MFAPSPYSGKITFRSGEFFEKLRLDGLSEELLGELNDASGVLDHLNGFNPGEIVEEPAATGVHEHGVALQFHQLPDDDLLFGARDRAQNALGQSARATSDERFENNVDVAVARRPRIAQQRRRRALRTSDATESRSQSSASRSGLRHSWFQPERAGVAAAVAAPALYAMNAAPGGIFVNLRFLGRRIIFEKLAVIRDLSELLAIRCNRAHRQAPSRRA